MGVDIAVSSGRVLFRFAPVFAALLILNACRNDPESIAIDGYPFAVERQETRTRIWNDISPELVAVLDSTAGVHRPLDLFADQDGNLFVTDFGDYRIKRFDALGNLVQVYGNGKGRAPGEFEYPEYASLDPLGNVWVPDWAAQRLAIFSSEGEWQRDISLDYRPMGIGHLSDGRYYVHITSGRRSPVEGMFGLYRGEDLLVRFGASEAHPRRVGGEIVVVDDDLVFSPSMLEFIVRYDESGDVLYARETLQQAPDSVLQEKAAASPFGPPLMLKTSIGHDAGQIYIDAWVLAEIRNAVVIDVYSAADGAYEHSFELPERRSMGMVVGGNTVYALRDTAVAAYRLPP